jgi:hypothetical protein
MCFIIVFSSGVEATGGRRYDRTLGLPGLELYYKNRQREIRVNGGRPVKEIKVNNENA